MHLLKQTTHFKKILMGIILFITLAPLNSQEYFPLNIEEVNPFDCLIMNPYSKPLDYAGTALEGLSLLTPAILIKAPADNYLKIGFNYAETIGLAWGVKELCKLCVSRPRPYMYFENPPEKEIEEGDWDDSFISGHTTLSFAAASFTTYMLCQYLPDSKLKTPMIILSYGLATATATIRLASGYTEFIVMPKILS